MKMKHFAAAAIAVTAVTLGGISQVQAAQVTPQSKWVCPNNQESCTGRETCQGYGSCSGQSDRTVSSSKLVRGGCCAR